MAMVLHIGFQTFPDEVLDLDKSVRTLDLTHNKLVDIPMEISKLVNMQRLILADNLIERLPMNLGKLQSLKVMMLDGNQITSLPDELGQLVRLERLSIQGNMLTFLPETIGSLRNLSLLNVSNNKLKTLPESIGSCFSLEELQANDNLIEDLPGSVCNLVHLKSLSLDNNNVNQIPSNLLKDCKALQNISLHDNPISMDQFQQKAEERILPTKEDIVWVKDQIRVNGLHMQENVLRKGINPSTRAQQLEDLIQDELSPMAALRYELPSQGCLSRQPLIVRGEDMEFFKFGSGVGNVGETIEIGNLDPKIATFRIDSGKLKGVLLESGSPEEFQLLPKLARSQPSVDKSKLQKASSVEEILGWSHESHMINDISAQADGTKLTKKKLPSLPNDSGANNNTTCTETIGYGLRENPKKTWRLADHSSEDTSLLDKPAKSVAKYFNLGKLCSVT
ncbi:hypothetical protein GH714_020994 [Hevea brasiliensis]|uniref:Uncharacterized protein n=1 Tax=Hevea brasiliensis TaxID=3981 RepID=A0A6A6MGU0_HEVBR|nr:hypothetical protein GH714_020994 [Hevea brasiliensis]